MVSAVRGVEEHDRVDAAGLRILSHVVATTGCRRRNRRGRPAGRSVSRPSAFTCFGRGGARRRRVPAPRRRCSSRPAPLRGMRASARKDALSMPLPSAIIDLREAPWPWRASARRSPVRRPERGSGGRSCSGCGGRACARLALVRIRQRVAAGIDRAGPGSIDDRQQRLDGMRRDPATAAPAAVSPAASSGRVRRTRIPSPTWEKALPAASEQFLAGRHGPMALAAAARSAGVGLRGPRRSADPGRPARRPGPIKRIFPLGVRAGVAGRSGSCRSRQRRPGARARGRRHAGEQLVGR
jgi:hypothetical protein